MNPMNEWKLEFDENQFHHASVPKGANILKPLIGPTMGQ